VAKPVVLGTPAIIGMSAVSRFPSAHEGPGGRHHRSAPEASRVQRVMGGQHLDVLVPPMCDEGT
jgi:hypothetical protein